MRTGGCCHSWQYLAWPPYGSARRGGVNSPRSPSCSSSFGLAPWSGTLLAFSPTWQSWPRHSLPSQRMLASCPWWIGRAVRLRWNVSFGLMESSNADGTRPAFSMIREWSHSKSGSKPTTHTALRLGTLSLLIGNVSRLIMTMFGLIACRNSHPPCPPKARSFLKVRICKSSRYGGRQAVDLKGRRRPMRILAISGPAPWRPMAGARTYWSRFLPQTISELPKAHGSAPHVFCSSRENR